MENMSFLPCAKNDPDYDNVYWRGAIWGPMNYLVYWGLKNYNPDLAADLADKSFNLFIDEWTDHKAVLENINSEKGVKSLKVQKMADPFYHWGALMGLMKFEEEGYMSDDRSRNQ